MLLIICSFFLEGNARWMHSAVTYSFSAPLQQAFQMFSSLEMHPSWSPWLEKVSFDKSTGISVWSVSYLGLRYSWKAVNTVVEPPYIIQWESLDGMPNKGRVEFLTNQITTANGIEEELTMKMTVSYDLPDAAAFVLNALGSIANTFINNLLLSDLKRFHTKLNESLQRNQPTQKEELSSEL
jgi:uncharacterized membrane protein